VVPWSRTRRTVVLFGDSITQESFMDSMFPHVPDEVLVSYTNVAGNVLADGWGARLSHFYVRKADVLNRGVKLCVMYCLSWVALRGSWRDGRLQRVQHSMGFEHS
jgi:hypothetical protein